MKKVRSGWFDDFVKWFFNASPVWVDERSMAREEASRSPRANRRTVDDRRSHPDPRGASQHAGKRSERA